MYFLDTNSVVYFLKGEGRVGERLLARNPTEMGLPAIVLYELEVGVLRSKAPARRRQQLDTLIAATALANRGTLVTHNAREFRRVRGLSVEDWY